jgi:hypothetical protein
MTRPVKPARGVVDWKRVSTKLLRCIELIDREMIGAHIENPWTVCKCEPCRAEVAYYRALTRERKTNKAREGGGHHGA